MTRSLFGVLIVVGTLSITIRAQGPPPAEAQGRGRGAGLERIKTIPGRLRTNVKAVI